MRPAHRGAGGAAAPLRQKRQNPGLLRIGSAYFDRCLDRIGKGEYDLAAQDCDQSFRLYPERFEVKLDIKARAFMTKGELDWAIADLSQPIHLKPSNYGTWFSRGEVHFKKSDYDRAIADFTEVIRLNPRHVSAYTAKGEAHAQKQEYAWAIADYDESIHLSPGASAPHYQRGFAHEQMGQRDKAVADYRFVVSFKRDVVRGARPMAICANQDLRTLAGEFDRAYRAAGIRWTASMSGSVKAAQLDWLKRRAACGADTKCLFDRYVEQIAWLDSYRPPGDPPSDNRFPVC